MTRRSFVYALVITVLIGSLAACSMQKLAQHMTRDGDMALAQGLMSNVRQGHFQAARASFPPQNAPSKATLHSLQKLLRDNPKPEITGVKVNKTNDSPWRTQLTYQLGKGDHVHAFGVLITGTDGHRHLQSMLLASTVDLTHWMHVAAWFFGIAALAILGVVVLVIWLVRRRKRARRGP